MAFTKVESGYFEQRPVTVRVDKQRPHPGSLTGFLALEHVRRLAGSLGTVMIHAALIGWFLTHLVEPMPPRSANSTNNLTLIDLGKAPEDSNAPEDSARTTETRLVEPPSTATALPAEWSMVRMRVRRDEPVPPSKSVAPSPVSSAAPIASSGGRAGGGYDPYAGAAPENMDRLLAKLKPPAALGFPRGGSDPAWMALLRQKVRQIDPSVRFPLKIRLVVTSEGRIIEVGFPEQATPARNRARISTELKRSLVLPVIAGVGLVNGGARQWEVSL